LSDDVSVGRPADKPVVFSNRNGAHVVPTHEFCEFDDRCVRTNCNKSRKREVGTRYTQRPPAQLPTPLTDARQFDILRPSPTGLGAHELHRLQRRDLITLLAGTTVLSPSTVRAQQRDRMRRVGVIMGFAEDDEVWQAYLGTFRQRLQDFGWTDGRNIRFDYRFTGESTERMRIAAAEVVALAPDVIFVSTNPVLSALSQLTRTIPIVFTWVSDSVGSGYVTSLARPAGWN
jgi:hypothetical protein